MSELKSVEKLKQDFLSGINICKIFIPSKEIDQACEFLPNNLLISASDNYLNIKIKNYRMLIEGKNEGKGQPYYTASLDFMLDNSKLYNFLVDKMLDERSSITWKGSLNTLDFIKMFEIIGRTQRPYLSNDQFKAIYLELLTSTGNNNVFPKHDTWLIHNIGSQQDWMHHFILYEEVSVLEKRNLLDDEAVKAQKKLVGDNPIDYYFYDSKNLDYLLEFMLASKKKNIVRSDVSLLREELGFSLTEGTVQSNTFKKIFDKRKEKDLELEF